MLRVNLVGTGKVGRTLMSRLAEHPGYEIGDIHSRRTESAKGAVKAVGAGHVAPSLAAMRAADIWCLAVPDDKIADIATELAQTTATESDAQTIAVHFSGFLSSKVLAPLAKRGWSTASCHPVLSFADPEGAKAQFPGTFCGIEGEALASARIAALMSDLGGRPFAVASAQKALYHAAAVFSNNFTVVLQAIALEAWAEAGVDDDVARDLCAALLRSIIIFSVLFLVIRLCGRGNASQFVAAVNLPGPDFLANLVDRHDGFARANLATRKGPASCIGAIGAAYQQNPVLMDDGSQGGGNRADGGGRVVRRQDSNS